MKRLFILAVLALAAVAFWLYRQLTRPTELPPQPRTLEQTVKALAPRMNKRLSGFFHQAGLSFPSPKIALLAFKEERRLDLYATDHKGKFRFVHSWPILAASGGPGPKLQEGDLQVPEGFYRIELLNPNSRFHLSLRVNYPNADDIAHAQAEGRATDNLGSDIMIHGGAASVGCLAIGDEAAEEVFYLVAKTGLDETKLLITPKDFRRVPAEVSDAYQRLSAALSEYPAP